MERSSGQPLLEWLGMASGGEPQIGGKAASLDRLARLGFRVPPGFCVTTEAFRLHVAATPGAADALGARAGAGELLEHAPLAPAIEAELGPALARLDEGSRARDGRPARLAIRSSAIGEDGAAASYAGLHETELDRTIDEARDAIRRCWASLWSAPAVAYRARRGLPLEGAAMAVVVQELVPADAAAVVFTRHPVTGRTDQLVVTAVRGLGDAMVSGTVTPDTFVVDRGSLAVVEHEPGEDEARPVGDAALRELARLCLAVEAQYGAPVDVEAARSGDEWYLLQARPITTGGAPGGPAVEGTGVAPADPASAVLGAAS